MKMSVVIPCLNEADCLPGLLEDLYQGLDLIREVIVVDGGSSDATCQIADEAGCRLIQTTPGRGQQIQIGCREARADWIWLLHADVRLEPKWAEILASQTLQTDRLYYGRFGVSDRGIWPMLLTWGVFLRCVLGKRPYGDQGFLIHQLAPSLRDGYPQIPLMDDVVFVDRSARSKREMLAFTVFSSPRRYTAQGYTFRILLNMFCYWSFRLGASPEWIGSIYTRRHQKQKMESSSDGQAKT